MTSITLIERAMPDAIYATCRWPRADSAEAPQTEPGVQRAHGPAGWNCLCCASALAAVKGRSEARGSAGGSNMVVEGCSATAASAIPLRNPASAPWRGLGKLSGGLLTGYPAPGVCRPGENLCRARLTQLNLAIAIGTRERPGQHVRTR